MSARSAIFGWSYQHDLGRKAMEKALGDKVESTYLENVPEGADAERSIEQLARTGHKLIFTTSFGFMDATVKVAAKYPNVFFEHATGYKRAQEPQRPMRRASMKAATSRARSLPRCRRAASSAISCRSRSRKSSPASTPPMLGAQIGQPEHQGQDHLGQFLVRSRQGSRRRQGADRPGRRHPDPAHRLAGGRCRSPRSAVSTRSANRPT